MDLDAARTAIAAAATAYGINGYPRPPGNVASFPAAVVQDPLEIEYHEAAASRHEALIGIRVIVSRSSEQESTVELDNLISYDELPAALEAATPTGYRELVVERCTGGYAAFAQSGNVVGLAADLTARVIFT